MTQLCFGLLCALFTAVSALDLSRALASDWIQLFNGTDLDDWDFKFSGHPLNEMPETNEGMPLVRVEDGILVVEHGAANFSNTGYGHFINKTRTFSHYLVRVEYMFVGEQASNHPGDWAFNNNGIMLHSQSMESMDLNQDFPISIEVQLLGDYNKQNNSSGATGQGITANLCAVNTHVTMNGEVCGCWCYTARHHEVFDNEWVRVEALVLGDSVIKHIVEGDTVLEYTKPETDAGEPMTEGYIALQAESSTTYFRKMELIELKGCMDPEAANYRDYYVVDDPESCVAKVEGCMDDAFLEYDPDANIQPEGACVTPKVYGCTVSTYREYNPDANVHVADSCVTGVRYPNGRFHGIHFDGARIDVVLDAGGEHVVRLQDLTGAVILAETGRGPRQYSLPLPEEAGVYVLIIENQSSVVRKKFLKF